jgi:hypothetical protein
MLEHRLYLASVGCLNMLRSCWNTHQSTLAGMRPEHAALASCLPALLLFLYKLTQQSGS